MSRNVASSRSFPVDGAAAHAFGASQVAMKDLDSESGYKRSSFERQLMLRLLVGAGIRDRRSELIPRNRYPVLPVQPFASPPVFSDECERIGHHAVAASGAGNDRRRGGVLVVARARERRGWVTPDKAQHPRLLPNGQRQRDGQDSSSNHTSSRYFNTAKRGPRRTALASAKASSS